MDIKNILKEFDIEEVKAAILEIETTKKASGIPTLAENVEVMKTIAGDIIPAGWGEEDYRFLAAADIYNLTKANSWVTQKAFDGSFLVNENKEPLGFLKGTISSTSVDKENDQFTKAALDLHWQSLMYRMQKFGEKVFYKNHKAPKTGMILLSGWGETEVGVYKRKALFYLENKEDREAAARGGFKGFSIAGRALKVSD